MNSSIWQRLIKAPILADEEMTRRARFLYAILMGVILTVSSLTLSFAWLGGDNPDRQSGLILGGLTTLIALILLVLVRLGKIQFVGVTFVTTLWVSLNLRVLAIGSIRTPMAIFHLTIIVIAGLILGGQGALVFACLSGLSTLFLYNAERLGFITHVQVPVGPMHWITYLIGFAITASLIYLANKNISYALARAQRNQAALTVSNRELQAIRALLERRVAKRTQDLEYQSALFKATAEVARDAITTRNLSDLLNRTVNLIQERFGYYHVRVFLVDDQGEYAVLRSATGEAGFSMLEDGYKLQIGVDGIVGRIIASGNPHIVGNVTADEFYVEHPKLSKTRSEMVLPLNVSGKTIGALDIQSQQKDAFSDVDVTALQTMADQLAVAIENVRLLFQMEEQIHNLELAYLHYTKAAWQEYVTTSKKPKGYRYRGVGVEPLVNLSAHATPDTSVDRGSEIQQQVTSDKPSFVVPIKLRQQEIGTLMLRFEEGDSQGDAVWLAQEVSNRLALSLENARLLEEIRQHSERLSLLQEITAAAASHIDLQSLLDATLPKLIQGLRLDRCSAVLFDSHNDEGALMAVITTNGGKLSTARPNIKIPIINHPATQQVILTQRSVLVENTPFEPFMLTRSDQDDTPQFSTTVLMPLMTQKEVIGLIGLEIEDPDRTITDQELQLLDQITLQIAVSVDVIRLFTGTIKRAENEKLISEATTRFRQSLDIDNVLQTGVREIQARLGLQWAEIQLVQPSKPAGPFQYDKNDHPVSGAVAEQPRKEEELTPP